MDNLQILYFHLFTTLKVSIWIFRRIISIKGLTFMIRNGYCMEKKYYGEMSDTQ
jgi:hypothetical protein